MSRTRWAIVIGSFAAMLAISGWLVWNALHKHGTLPSLPLWAHAAAFGLVCLEAASRSIKIQWGAHALHIPLNYWAAVRTSVGGDFASCLTPSRSGAEPARFLVLAETGMPVASILLVLFLELLMEAVTFVVIAIAAWIIFDSTKVVLGMLTTIMVGYAAFVFGVGAFGLFLAQRNASGPPPDWVRSVGLNAGHWRGIQRSLRHLRVSLEGLRRASPRLIIQSFLASLVHVSSKLALLPLIVWSLDKGADLAGTILWPLVMFYGLTVIPAPGGGGAIEAVFKHTFDGQWSDQTLVVALLWWRFYSFYMYIVLGAFAGGATVFRALRSDKGEAKKV